VLELWRGRPLDNLDGAWVERLRETLQQQHVEVLADWADGMIELGRPAGVAERLAGPVSAAPSAERLVAARMRALQRTGRTAEALECFARSRRRTITELGVEPSAPLRKLHLELLRTGAQ
jgi:DNA-binding SARP family transcriptional activator